MNWFKLALAAVACSTCLGAAAQWQWVDKDGRKVFSDRPPPADVPASSILKQPGGATAPRVVQPADANATAAPAARPGASLPATAGKDKELEARKAQAEAAEEAKRKAEEEKVAKLKAENCTRARQSKALFDSGKPVARANAQGEREFLDEAARNAEAKRLDGIIASDCAR